jgi:hypothetical protein
MKMAKWVVDVKGCASEQFFEITVLRDDYDYGKKSYGGIGEKKLLISHSGGPCRCPIIPIVWDKAIKLAHEVADELNKAEGLLEES